MNKKIRQKRNGYNNQTRSLQERDHRWFQSVVVGEICLKTNIGGRAEVTQSVVGRRKKEKEQRTGNVLSKRNKVMKSKSEWNTIMPFLLKGLRWTSKEVSLREKRRKCVREQVSQRIISYQRLLTPRIWITTKTTNERLYIRRIQTGCRLLWHQASKHWTYVAVDELIRARGLCYYYVYYYD